MTTDLIMPSIYDTLLAEKGDPVVRPHVDRSYAAILAEATDAKAS